jgi:hypothetical protein
VLYFALEFVMTLLLALILDLRLRFGNWTRLLQSALRQPGSLRTARIPVSDKKRRKGPSC